MDSPGYDERTKKLSEEAGQRSIQKASKLGHAAESAGENVGVEEPTKAKVGEIAVVAHRERDEGTLVYSTSGGEPFHPD